jgi:hypothetical protein
MLVLFYQRERACLKFPRLKQLPHAPFLARCRLFRRHRSLRVLLDGESSASARRGSYDPAVLDPIDANALSSTAWELALLKSHYHPHAAQSAAAISQIPPNGGAGSLNGIINTAAEPTQLAAVYACGSTGLFRPPPQKECPQASSKVDRCTAKAARDSRVQLQPVVAETVGAYGACNPWLAWPFVPWQERSAKSGGALDCDSVDEAALQAELLQRFRCESAG